MDYQCNDRAEIDQLRYKKDRTIAYCAMHPESSPEDIALAVGSTVSAVRTIQSRYKDDIASMMSPSGDPVPQLELDLGEFAVAEEEPRVSNFDVNSLLEARGKRYTTHDSTFADLAEIAQRFKGALEYFLITRSKYLAPDQHEAIDMIFHKLARVINGDPDYVDNWKDIAGYATLIVDRLEGRAR